MQQRAQGPPFVYPSVFTVLKARRPPNLISMSKDGTVRGGHNVFLKDGALCGEAGGTASPSAAHPTVWRCPPTPPPPPRLEPSRPEVDFFFDTGPPPPPPHYDPGNIFVHRIELN